MMVPGVNATTANPLRRSLNLVVMVVVVVVVVMVMVMVCVCGGGQSSVRGYRVHTY